VYLLLLITKSAIVGRVAVRCCLKFFFSSGQAKHGMVKLLEVAQTCSLNTAFRVLTVYGN